MADGGKAWKKRYLGSNDGTTTSTRCRGARRSCGREESGNGTVVRELDAGGARRRARQHGRALLLLLRLRERECEMRCAARAADVGGRVGAAAGRGCRAACVASTRRPRGGRRLTRSGAWRGERRGAREKGPARGGRPSWHGMGLGRAKARRAALRKARWAGFGRRARSEAAAREVGKNPFPNKIFKEFLNAIFQILF